MGECSTVDFMPPVYIFNHSQLSNKQSILAKLYNSYIAQVSSLKVQCVAINLSIVLCTYFCIIVHCSVGGMYIAEYHIFILYLSLSQLKCSMCCIFHIVILTDYIIFMKHSNSSYLTKFQICYYIHVHIIIIYQLS